VRNDCQKAELKYKKKSTKQKTKMKSLARGVKKNTQLPLQVGKSMNESAKSK